MKIRKLIITCRKCKRKVAYYYYRRVLICPYCGELLMIQTKLAETTILNSKREVTICW